MGFIYITVTLSLMEIWLDYCVVCGTTIGFSQDLKEEEEEWFGSAPGNKEGSSPKSLQIR